MNKYILAAVCTILAATISLSFSGTVQTKTDGATSGSSGANRSGINKTNILPQVYPTFGSEDKTEEINEKPLKEGEERYPTVKAFEKEMIGLASKVQRACVRIHVLSKTTENKMDSYKYINFSGVIVGKDGYILTLAQPLTNADAIIVNFGMNSYKASKWAVDDDSKLAIVKIDEKDLPEANFADSSKIKPGSVLVLSGNPYGLSGSVKYAMVSGTERVMYINDTANFGVIQIDTSTNPGEPGGPCVNSDGNLAGILWSSYVGEETVVRDSELVNRLVEILDKIIKPEMKEAAKQVIAELLEELSNKYSDSALYQSDRISFVLPSNQLKKISNDLIKYKKIRKAFIGIIISHDSNTKTGENKFKISQISKESPAEKYGLKIGDEIIEVDGKPLKNLLTLYQKLSLLDPGDEIELTVKRDDAEKKIKLILGEYPE